MKIILSDRAIDYKSKLLIPSNYKQLDVSLRSLLEHIIFKNNVCCFHFRYLHLKGWVKPVVRYAVIFTLLKIRNVPILWSMHNFHEHMANSISLNNVIKKYLLKEAKAVIVFHKSIKKKMPIQIQEKVYVSNFGSVKNIINMKSGEEERFWKEYELWKGSNEVDILIVSTALHNDYRSFVENLDSKYNILIINKFDNWNYIKDNIFLFKGSFFTGIDKVIRENNRDLIGVIFHNNLSVATSYYLYSDYNIPIITNNTTPNNDIIEEFNMGVVLSKRTSINECINEIKSRYSHYSENSNTFSKVNTWEKGMDVYQYVLNKIENK